MPFSFPASPTLNQQWPTENPRFQWDGVKWRAIGGGLPATAEPVTSRLPSLNSTDDTIYIRGGVPHLVSVAVQAATFGGEPPSATAPAAMTVGQWSAEPTVTPGEMGINIITIPSDGGSVPTALEYRVDGGAAIALSGTGTGLRVVTAGFTAGVAADIQVRAVNAVGAADWSDTKNRTPAAAGGGGGPAQWQAANTFEGDARSSTPVSLPAGTSATDVVVALTTRHATGEVSAPPGWTLIGEVYSNFAGVGVAAYWALGNVASTSWVVANQLTSVISLHRISGADTSNPIRAFAVREADSWGSIGNVDMPSPPVVAGNGDSILSIYVQPQSDNAVGTPSAGYTRRLDYGSPNRVSVVERSNVAAGSTGEISHNASAAWQARAAITVAIRAAS